MYALLEDVVCCHILGSTDDEVKATDGLGINPNGGSYGIPVVNCRISLNEKWNAVELNTTDPLASDSIQ